MQLWCLCLLGLWGDVSWFVIADFHAPRPPRSSGSAWLGEFTHLSAVNVLVPFPSPPSPWTLPGAVCQSDYHTPCPVPANFSLSMCSVPQAAYPPAASMAQPPAMSRHPLSHVSSVRQVSTQVSHQVPHARRVGEFGQGQKEWDWACCQGGLAGSQSRPPQQ